MRNLIVYLVLMAVAISCKKENATNTQPPVSNIEYSDFNNKQVKFNESFRSDLNKDGVNDIRFHTLYVGDPLLKRDYRQFYVSSSIDTYLPVNNQEEVPVLSKGALISAEAFNGYQWYNASAILLARKVITETEAPFWEGFWKDKSNKYVPVLVTKGHNQYYGWVEVSFSTTAENIVVHSAGINKEARKEVKAGL